MKKIYPQPQIDAIVNGSHTLMKLVEYEDPETIIVKDGDYWMRIPLRGEDGVYEGQTVEGYERDEIIELKPIVKKVRAWRPVYFPHETRGE